MDYRDPVTLGNDVPRLSVDWDAAGGSVLSSLKALFARVPEIPELPNSDGYSGALRISQIQNRFPASAIVASVLWHCAAIAILTLPIWQRLDRDRAQLELPQVELAWYQPRDLPRLSPPETQPKVEPAPKPTLKSLPPPAGADAFHPRQTIVSMPQQLTHPRQTLIQPDAPPVAPKIVPPMPNIATWASEAPKVPKMQFAAAVPKSVVEARGVAAPEIQNSERDPAMLNIAAAPIENLHPALALNTHVAPTMRKRATSNVDDVAPADLMFVQTDPGLKRLIAISANPAPPAPGPPPKGNLAARVTISREGSHAGVPGGLPGSPGAATSAKASAGTRGAETGPPGISISNSKAPANVTGLAGISPARPLARGISRSEQESPVLDLPASAINIDPGAPPERILGGKRIYSLHVNLPNLTSASGSWVLNFAALHEERAPLGAPVSAQPLAAPEPLRKVDPRYPPELIKERVSGEVVLYGIIRKDGTVDSIQVIRGLDPALDQDAMEALAQWKFRPAEKNGEPVDVEAVVHIPFHIRGEF
jgi:TonB family protein